jgi:hypothetical protein
VLAYIAAAAAAVADEAEPDSIDLWQRREAARIRWVCGRFYRLRVSGCVRKIKGVCCGGSHQVGDPVNTKVARALHPRLSSHPPPHLLLLLATHVCTHALSLSLPAGVTQRSVRRSRRQQLSGSGSNR